MKANAYPLEKIFDTAIQFRVPLFQRPYVWELNVDDPSDDRLSPFWDDVRGTVDRYLERREALEKGVPEDALAVFADHFFGAVVLGLRVMAFGGIPHQEVIDGQQRFTTVQLLIAAVHRIARDSGNDTTAEALADLYLNPPKHDPQPNEVQKLWPTNANQLAYSAVMDPDGPLPIPDDPNNRIQEAYEFFSMELAAWLTELPADERERHIKALHIVIRSHLKFVVIELEDGDNAQEIFESLNAQGTPLLAIDLVKNHVFRRADDAKLDLSKLDEEVWRPLDDKWWRAMQSQGRYRRPRAELFLMHWLTMQKRDEVPAIGLFVEFQRQSSPAVVPDDDIRPFVESFIDDANLYRSFEAQPEGSIAKRFFNRLKLLDTTALYPVVLRLFKATEEGDLTVSQRDATLRAIESWLVRRVVCDFTSKNYNRTSIELLKKIQDADLPPDVAVIDFLCEATSDTELWPSDSEFREALIHRPLYSRIKPVRRVRLLLEACELELRLASKGYVEVGDQAAPEIAVSLTVEHILPQKWRDTWPVSQSSGEAEISDDEHEILEAERDAHVHRLGNLTLVTQKLNSHNSNSPWAQKQDALKKNSVFLMNSDLVIKHGTAWNESTIQSRGAEMADLLVNHWQGGEHWGSRAE